MEVLTLGISRYKYFIILKHFSFKFGNTPEFYLNHDESDKILSHKDLLRRFGAAETLADEMLNDQGIFIDVKAQHTHRTLNYF